MTQTEPRGQQARSHKHAIRRGSLIAYMCDHMFVQLKWGLKLHICVIACLCD
jgi:hypothetical protein